MIVLISLAIILLSVFDYELDESTFRAAVLAGIATLVLHTTLGSSREYRTYDDSSPNPYDDRILDLSDKPTVTSLELNYILAEMQKTVQERQTIIQQLEHDIVQRDIKRERKNARQSLAQNGAFFVLGILASIIIGN